MEFKSRVFVCLLVVGAVAVSCFGQKSKTNNNNGDRVPYGIGKLTWAEYALLEDSVKYIVGPHAPVTPEILAFAESQPGIPRNFHEMMLYMPFYFSQARQIGLKPVPNAYNEGIENPANIDTIVNRRATQWWVNNGYVSQHGKDYNYGV